MKAILICNGNAPAGSFLKKIIKNYDAIACADGGANLAYRFEIQPNFIIGDLDSIEKNVKDFFERKGVEIIHDSDQNSTDIEKSIKFLIRLGYTSVDIISAIGDRIDHNLGNLSVLVNYHRRARLRIIDKGIEILFASGKFLLKVNKGDIISLIPFGKKVFISKTIGLKFKLENESLIFSGRGISNIATANRILIHVKRGGVFVIRKLSTLKL